MKKLESLIVLIADILYERPYLVKTLTEIYQDILLEVANSGDCDLTKALPDLGECLLYAFECEVMNLIVSF